MSQSHLEKLKVTIPDGEASSNPIYTNQIGDAAAIGIISPDGLEADTFVIEVNHEKDGTGDWARLQDRDGNDSVVPVANRAMWYPELPSFPAFRITNTSGNVGADREFTVLKTHTI